MLKCNKSYGKNELKNQRELTKPKLVYLFNHFKIGNIFPGKISGTGNHRYHSHEKFGRLQF